jgi:hypothetical protein
MVTTPDLPGPSPEYLALVATAPRALARILARGQMPDPAHLAGWEWRGTNIPATARLLGLRRFIKGFVGTDDGAVEGYNVSVRGADLSTPWMERRQRDGRRAWAPFTVAPVDPTAIDNRLLHALLLDYGATAESEPGIAGHLRDDLVRVVPGSDELLLGHAHLALGRYRLPVGWFVLERLARVEAPGDARR